MRFQSLCNLGFFLLGAGTFSMGTLLLFIDSGAEEFRHHGAFQYFLRHKDAFDVVFAGSSYTAYQVDPVIFDDQCAQHGVKVRSINLAMPAATFYEIDDLIRRVLAVSPARLRYIIMDPREAEEAFREDSIDTRRAIRWHTPRQTLRAVRRSLQSDAELPARLRSSYLHLSHMVTNVSLIGSGRLLLSSPPQPGDGAPGRDFPYDENSDDEEEIHAPDLQRLMDAYGTLQPQAALATLDLRAFDEQMQLLDDKGIVPVFVASPALKIENLAVQALEREGRVPHVIDLDDVEAFPLLFDPRHRYEDDFIHLARTHTIIDYYTRLLADRFVTEVVQTKSDHVPPAGSP